MIEETIRVRAGHESKKMLERYSHIPVHAKQAAIAALERSNSPNADADAEPKRDATAHF